ncbi:uncharacterized protein LOC143180478 [Calliopsis andreniformis]|uniref:uncharacterized protein LOC143180478 n=1 Tax=Calliopsis andreniformis TaxID=337506 RepID=UPI003FCED1CC
MERYTCLKKTAPVEVCLIKEFSRMACGKCVTREPGEIADCPDAHLLVTKAARRRLAICHFCRRILYGHYPAAKCMECRQASQQFSEEDWFILGQDRPVPIRT